MSELSKFPKPGDSASLDEAAAAALAREWLSAAGAAFGPAEEADEPGANAARPAPARQVETLELTSAMEWLGGPGVAMEDRLALYPEHYALAIVWVGAVALGLWRWFAAA